MIRCVRDNLPSCKRLFLGMINEAQQKQDTVLFTGEMRRLFQRVGPSSP